MHFVQNLTGQILRRRCERRISTFFRRVAEQRERPAAKLQQYQYRRPTADPQLRESDPCIGELIRDFHKAGRPIAMVCHAPAILRDVKKDDGQYLVKGLNVTGFKNAEDTEIELLHHLLFSLEDELKNRGANYQSKANWEPNVVVDGVLMMGQSPASAVPLAEALAKAELLGRLRAPQNEPFGRRDV
ncbi:MULTISPECIES: DJ-1/PfpI family protein [Rhizobium]|uniref:DJ-1/PfpI domain-containing protein n=1 Tax=Rhizobium paranaense TaxID=1650438 RepID=A0A7W8XY96_9HYPH|nr:DJ-1/PfpI family protein [Rhizobium paranaense]MBB5577795.1 hypothetical protein [Rhizobium paranaense]